MPEVISIPKIHAILLLQILQINDNKIFLGPVIIEKICAESDDQQALTKDNI